MTHDHILSRNLVWGLRWGLAAGAVIASTALLLGHTRLDSITGQLLDPGLPLWRVALIILAGAAASGIAMGLVRPLNDSWLGRRKVGLVTAAPFVSAYLNLAVHNGAALDQSTQLWITSTVIGVTGSLIVELVQAIHARMRYRLPPRWQS